MLQDCHIQTSYYPVLYLSSALSVTIAEISIINDFFCLNMYIVTCVGATFYLKWTRKYDNLRVTTRKQQSVMRFDTTRRKQRNERESLLNTRGPWASSVILTHSPSHQRFLKSEKEIGLWLLRVFRAHSAETLSRYHWDHNTFLLLKYLTTNTTGKDNNPYGNLTKCALAQTGLRMRAFISALPQIHHGLSILP